MKGNKDFQRRNPGLVPKNVAVYQDENGMEIAIFGEPPTATHQQKKVRCTGRVPMFYEPPKLKAARKMFKESFQNIAHEKLQGPVRIAVVWYYSAPKTRNGEIWKVTRPDTDNAVKLIKDVLTDCGYWNDDAQVCDEHLQKKYSEVPRIEITIEKISQ